jgi:PKD repeat protein
VKVVAANGAQSTQTVTISSTGGEPVAQCTSVPPPDAVSGIVLVHVNEPIQFIDQSTNDPTSWLWRFGDNTSSTNKNPIHAYTVPNELKDVLLIATNALGVSQELKAPYVFVRP